MLQAPHHVSHWYWASFTICVKLSSQSDNQALMKFDPDMQWIRWPIISNWKRNTPKSRSWRFLGVGGGGHLDVCQCKDALQKCSKCFGDKSWCRLEGGRRRLGSGLGRLGGVLGTPCFALGLLKSILKFRAASKIIMATLEASSARPYCRTKSNWSPPSY